MKQSSGLRPYVVGFAGSLVLTLTAYGLVVTQALPRTALLVAVAGLALTQFVVQAVWFLHLGVGAPRWKVVVFWFMLLVVVILVAGSLWIMTNLSYHMTPLQIDTYLRNQDGL